MIPAIAILAEVTTLGASLWFGRNWTDKEAQLVKWIEFLGRMSNGNPRYADDGRYGAYEISTKRLCDMELMHSPSKVPGGWSGEWLHPYSQAKFLDDTTLQLEVFRRSMRDYGVAVSPYLGADVDGGRATRSGLLGVAHRAGIKGLRKWLASEDDRIRFSRTTAVYYAVNEIF